jgi:hypothetical protein
MATGCFDYLFDRIFEFKGKYNISLISSKDDMD